MSWWVEFTSQARADLVGLDREISEAITDALVEWLEHGPPVRGERKLADITFYEELVADRILIGYVVRHRLRASTRGRERSGGAEHGSWCHRTIETVARVGRHHLDDGAGDENRTRVLSLGI